MFTVFSCSVTKNNVLHACLPLQHWHKRTVTVGVARMFPMYGANDVFVFGDQKSTTLIVFSRSGTKKHCVYNTFALGNKKSMTFIVFLRSGTKSQCVYIVVALGEKFAPSGFSLCIPQFGESTD